MDLLEFSEKTLYFNEPLPEKAIDLLNSASEQYGDENVEPLLLEAFELVPEHLTVLVALYRFYYYQHRLEDALVIADQALAVSGKRLNFPEDWKQLNKDYLGAGALISMGMVRFYLLALKASGYLNLRLQRWDTAFAMLTKVSELDEADRLGTAALLDIAHSVFESEQLKYAAM